MKAPAALCAFSALSLFTGSLAATNSSSSSSSTSALLADGNVNLGIAAEAYAKAKAFVATLTNTQKISVITGSSLTGNATWAALEAEDGAAGVNMQFYVSAFAAPSALTMTWNRDLFEQQFKALGDEFYLMGYNLIDGPVSSPMGRVPQGGRVPEGSSPEPYLNGIHMGLAVKGMNSAGVVAAGRHFLFNEQETNRSTTTRYSSDVDDKTTQEVYLWPFADGVNNGMMAVMCAMTRANDTLSCQNDQLLSKYLKTELGFPGMVFPDAEAQQSGLESANAGLDFGSGQYWTDTVLLDGIAAGNFTQERLDDMAVRNVMGYYYVGLDNGTQASKASTTEYRSVRANHSKLIRQVGGESIVLLKNNNADGRGLPLNNPLTLSLYGAHAGPAMAGPNRAFSISGEADTFQGHLASSGGAGQVSFPYLITPHTALTMRAASEGSMIWWILNNTYTASASTGAGGFGGGGVSPFGAGGGTSGNGSSTAGGGPGGAGGAPGGAGGGGTPGGLGQGTAVTPSLSEYASDDSGVCLVFINADSGEGADRTELKDTEQDTLVTTVADNCNNTVVVVNTVGPRILDAWIEHDNVTAVLYAGVLGQESGNAITDVLYGDVNPSAKLSYSIAKNASDYQASVCETAECDFTEGVYLDYRWLEAHNTTARFPFGHGLSYTNFTYGTVAAAATNKTALASKYATGALGLGGPADLWDEVAAVTSSVENAGAVAGMEVAQLYVSFPAAAEQPAKVLRGFQKTASLAPGKMQDVTFSLRRRDLSYWDTAAQKWAVASGEYTFAVGSSSQDIRGTAKLTV